MAGLALLMLALLALVPAATRVGRRLQRELPYCMEHDPATSWPDHQVRACICPKTETTRSTR